MNDLARILASVVFPTPRVPVKQIGVVQTLLAQGVSQGSNNVLLPDQALERFRSPLPCQYLISHRWILTRIVLETSVGRAGNASPERYPPDSDEHGLNASDRW